MRIQVRAGAYIVDIFNSRKMFFELQEHSSLGDLLRELTDSYGSAFYKAVCTEEGYSANHVAILVNGSNAAAIGGTAIRLKDGDDVLFMPILSGG